MTVAGIGGLAGGAGRCVAGLKTRAWLSQVHFGGGDGGGLERDSGIDREPYLLEASVNPLRVERIDTQRQVVVGLGEAGVIRVVRQVL
jgi:hypothetical protein